MQKSTYSDPVSLIDRAIVHSDFGVAREIAAVVGTQTKQLRWLPDYVRAYNELAKGNASDAERLARKLVASDPSDARPRHLLILSLWAQQKYRPALYQIEVNRAYVSDPAMKTTYATIVREYDAINKPYGVSVSVGAAPSTNINEGTSSRTVEIGGLPFVIDDDSRQKKGINLSASATAYYSFRLGETTDLVAKGSVFSNKNLEDSDRIP